MKVMRMYRHVIVAETLEDVQALAKSADLTARMPEEADHIFITDESDGNVSFSRLNLGKDALIVEPNGDETVWYVDTIENVARDFTLCPES